MTKKFLYKNRNDEFNAIAEEYKFPYGKSVAITIFQKDDTIRSKIKFVCHPENVEFDHYQSMNINQLIDIAIERITSGMYDSSFDYVQEHKLEILVPFNPPDDSTKTSRRASAGP